MNRSACPVDMSTLQQQADRTEQEDSVRVLKGRSSELNSWIRESGRVCPPHYTPRFLSLLLMAVLLSDWTDPVIYAHQTRWGCSLHRRLHPFSCCAETKRHPEWPGWPAAHRQHLLPFLQRGASLFLWSDGGIQVRACSSLKSQVTTAVLQVESYAERSDILSACCSLQSQLSLQSASVIVFQTLLHFQTDQLCFE